MKRFQWKTIILLFALAQCARADSISTFNINTITVLFSPIEVEDNVFFRLTGPGADIWGAGAFYCPGDWCSKYVSFSPGSKLYPSVGGFFIHGYIRSILGGKSYSSENGEFGLNGLSVLVSQAFFLPLNPKSSVFSVCVAATMPTEITGITGAGETFREFQLRTPSGGSLCTKWDFSSGEYHFDSRKFFVTTVPVPESESFALVGMGLVAVIATAASVGKRCGRSSCESGLPRLRDKEFRPNGALRETRQPAGRECRDDARNPTGKRSGSCRRRSPN